MAILLSPYRNSSKVCQSASKHLNGWYKNKSSKGHYITYDILHGQSVDGNIKGNYEILCGT